MTAWSRDSGARSYEVDMDNNWFMDYAEHAVRVTDIETRWYELRGWITKNGRHILIGDDGGSSRKKVDKTAESGIIKSGAVSGKRFDEKRLISDKSAWNV